MSSFSEIESLLLLCFYYFDKAKNTSLFVKRYNDYFDKDVSEQSILYELSVIRGSETSANMTITDDRRYYRNLWKKYTSKGTLELRGFYSDFKKGRFIIQDDTDDEKEEDIGIGNVISEVIDKPIEKPPYLTNKKEVIKRRQQVIWNALAYANYSCECECGVPLFLRKDKKASYTEGHHLIPVKYQPEFYYSLDVEANVVSLCPRCHRQLHYGSGSEILLSRLFNKRAERLKNCGIEIRFEDLLLMYR